MHQTEIGFLAVITRRPYLSSERNHENPKIAFWTPIRRRVEVSTDDFAEDALEARIERAFPQQLHAALRRHFLAFDRGALPWVRSVPVELNGVFFRARITGYGSADLEVTIGGLKEISSLVHDHLETFTMLMEAFVPSAFADSLSGAIGPEEFTARIEPTAALKAAFAASQPPKSAAEELPWSKKAARALTSTAISLLTPVLLALAVLWVAAQLLINDREHLQAREKRIAEEEAALYQADANRLSALQTQTLELIRLLRAPPASSPGSVHPGSPTPTP